MAAGWSADSTLDHRGQTQDTPAEPSLSATRAKHRINIRCKTRLVLPPSCLSAVSPCWSELGAACSHWCRGRGICWFVRKLVDLEPPAPGRWTPAWRGAARHQDRPQPLLPPNPPHPARLLHLGRTHAGRTPGGQNTRNVLKKMVFKCASVLLRL